MNDFRKDPHDFYLMGSSHSINESIIPFVVQKNIVITWRTHEYFITKFMSSAKTNSPRFKFT